MTRALPPARRTASAGGGGGHAFPSFVGQHAPQPLAVPAGHPASATVTFSFGPGTPLYLLSTPGDIKARFTEGVDDTARNENITALLLSLHLKAEAIKSVKINGETPDSVAAIPQQTLKKYIITAFSAFTGGAPTGDYAWPAGKSAATVNPGKAAPTPAQACEFAFPLLRAFPSSPLAPWHAKQW